MICQACGEAEATVVYDGRHLCDWHYPPLVKARDDAERRVALRCFEIVEQMRQKKLRQALLFQESGQHEHSSHAEYGASCLFNAAYVISREFGVDAS